MEEDLLAKLVARMRAIGTDTQHVEVKTAVGGMPTTIAETVSAFANGSGGTIILGLSEKDGFAPAAGFKARSMFDSLSTICADKLNPPVHANISIYPFEGAEVVVADIPETAPSRKPCYIVSRGMYSGSFIRIGDGDRSLTEYEIDRFMEERIQPRHDLELVEKSSLEDLDKDLVKAVLASQRSMHPRMFGKLSDEEALAALNIATKDSLGETRLTLAGLVALGTYPQHYFPCLTIDFACYSTLTKASKTGRKFIDSQTFIGPISYMLLDAVRAVRRNTSREGVLVGALRCDVPDYPEEAVREAICNALMHRDYSYLGRGSAVQVDLYPDRLEVLSPGGLYGSVTLENLGEVGESSHRNQCLAKLLESVPYEEGGSVAENRGMGLNLIKAELEECGMPAPIIISTPSRFRIIMYRRGMSPDQPASLNGQTTAGAAIGLSSLPDQRSVSLSEEGEPTLRQKAVQKLLSTESEERAAREEAIRKAAESGRAATPEELILATANAGAHLSQVKQETHPQLSNAQQQIYYALVNLEQAKTGEVMEATGYSRVTVVKGLKKLTELGLVEVDNRGDSKNSPQRCYRLPNAG